MLGEKEYTCASVNAYVALSGKHFLLAKLARGVFIIYASCSLPAHLPQRRFLSNIHYVGGCIWSKGFMLPTTV